MAYKPMVRSLQPPTSLSGLLRPGVGATDITKLKANGYYTVAVRKLQRVHRGLLTTSSLCMPQLARLYSKSRALVR